MVIKHSASSESHEWPGLMKEYFLLLLVTKVMHAVCMFHKLTFKQKTLHMQIRNPQNIKYVIHAFFIL